jgi:hypothetical protein
MASTTPQGDSHKAVRLRATTLRAIYDSSGRRWFILGAMLLTVMGIAVWTVRHDPLAISTLFFAIAAILGTVPSIMEARNRFLHGGGGSRTESAAETDGRHSNSGT